MKIRKAKIEKTSLMPSPEPSKELTDIKPNEVSVVDMPANGEPFMVVKNVKSDSSDKLSTEQVSKFMMNRIEKNIRNVKDDIDSFIKISKSFKTNIDDKSNSDTILFDMSKFILKSLSNVKSGNGIISVDIVKKLDDDISKSNAVSYLVRDQFVEVSQYVSEYLTTYLEGIEHDDNGPTIIPSNIDETIDGSIEKFNKFISSCNDNEYIEVECVDFDNIQKSLNKNISIGLDIINTLKKLESDVKKINESKGDNEMDEKNVVKSEESSVETSEKSVDEVIEDSKDCSCEKSVESDDKENALENTIKSFVSMAEKLEKSIDSMSKKFEDFDKSLNDLNEVVKKNEENIEKMSLARNTSKGSSVDTTETVNKKDNRSSFRDILGLR